MRGFKPKLSESKHNERIRQGGSNFGGHSAKGIKHGVRGRNLDEITESGFPEPTTKVGSWA